MASTSPYDEPARSARASVDLGEDQGAGGQARAGFDLRYVIAAIRSNLLLIAAIVAGTVAVAVVATMLQTPRYTAATTIQINDSVRRVLKSDDEADAADSGGYDTDRNLKTYVGILNSRGLAQRVVRKLKLASNPQFFSSQGASPPPTGAPNARTEAAAAGLLQGNLNVVVPRDSRIMTINWESADPRMSALIANAYAAEFIQSDLQRKFDSSSYARNFVSEQLAETKQKVEASERALNDYARSSGLIRPRDTAGSTGKDGGGGESVTTTNLLALNTALNEATALRISAEARWEAMAGKPLLSANEVLNSATVSGLVNARALAEAALQEERSRHLDGYPTVVAKQAEIAGINRQIQQAASNVKAAIRADYVAAVQTENKLAAEVSQLKGETLSEQDQSVGYGMLAREADTNRQLYDGLLQRYKELNASAGIALSNISIVDAAMVPGGPSSPNLLKNLMIAVMLGGAMAALTVFLKEQFDDSIRVPEDVEAKLGLPLLGVVPRARDEEPEDALADPKSPISEAYNSLRSSLLYSTAEGLPQIILFTSAQPAEGKSTSSYACAVSFARMGKSVLLIDADLRRPSLHRRINCENNIGLSTLLTSRDPLASVLLPSGEPGLQYVTSGSVPPSPTELLSGMRLEQILHEAAKQFEVVIIDSPPILGLADAPTMAALADGVVFVVEADCSRRGSLKSALRRLRTVQPIMLGAVLAKFDPLKSGNRYSEYYGYAYYQYGDSQKAA